MLPLLLVACTPDPKPDETGEGRETAAVDTGDTDETDTAPDTDTDDTPPDTDTDDTPPEIPALPTAARPFVVTGCGFDDSGPELVLTPDRDGDEVEDLLLVVDADVEVWGTWLMPSTTPSGFYWDQPVHWAVAPAEGIQALPDLDGDGLAELFAYGDTSTATQLLPDGSVGDTWSDVPARFVPWHDVDGDGRDELLVGAPALYAADATEPGYVGLVSAAAVDPASWISLTTMHDDAARELGAALVLTTLDQDGDGWPEVIATDFTHAYLLSSAAIDAGATLAEATLATFEYGAGLTPVPLGDVDGGGAEDFAFQPPGGFPGYLWLYAGEAPDAPVYFEDSLEIWSVAIGPDGAGGLAIWAPPAVYDLAEALLGRYTILRRDSGVPPDRIAASRDLVWVSNAEGGRWEPRTVARRLDPATADGVLAEVQGGGPGYGGDVNGYGLDEIDGDGALDWWQLEDGAFQWAPVTPGTTISVCDADTTSQPDWTAADPGGDLDGDGVPEVTWWAEPDTIGLWSAVEGAVAEVDYDGALSQLGCDLTGDGVGELVLNRGNIIDGATWLRVGIGVSVLADIQLHALCVGDLTGDGVDEVADVYTDIRVYDGASIAAGAPEVLSYVDGPTVGRIQRLGDIDGDGLGDLAFQSFGYDTEYFGHCIVRGAELLASPVLAVTDLTFCWESPTWYRAADVDRDGVNEILSSDTDGLTAWWPSTGATERVWTPDDDTRAEPLLDVVQDAFGPGRAAVVLGPDPIVVYALGE